MLVAVLDTSNRGHISSADLIAFLKQTNKHIKLKPPRRELFLDVAYLKSRLLFFYFLFELFLFHLKLFKFLLVVFYGLLVLHQTRPGLLIRVLHLIRFFHYLLLLGFLLLRRLFGSFEVLAQLVRAVLDALDLVLQLVDLFFQPTNLLLEHRYIQRLRDIYALNIAEFLLKYQKLLTRKISVEIFEEKVMVFYALQGHLIAFQLI